MSRRRRVNVGGVRQLPSGRWQARVRGKVDGRRWERAVVVDTEAQANDALVLLQNQAIEVKLGLAPAVKRRDPALVELLELMANDTGSTRKRRKPWSGSRRRAAKKLAPLHHIPLLTFRVDDWNRFFPRLDVSDSYKRLLWHMLKSAAKRAVAEGWIDAIPPAFQTVPACVPRGDSKKRKPFTPEQLLTLIRNAAEVDRTTPQGMRDALLRCLLLLHTACRPIELRKMQPSWLGPGCESVDFPGWATGKGGRDHSSEIYPDLAAMLRDHMDRLPAEARATGVVFPVLGGRMRRRWKARASLFSDSTKALLLAGLPEGSVVYQLRHTRLTDVMREHGAVAAAEHGGHTTTRMVENHYGHIRKSAGSAVSSDVTPVLAQALALATGVSDPDDDPPPTNGGTRAEPPTFLELARAAAAEGRVYIPDGKTPIRQVLGVPEARRVPPAQTSFQGHNETHCSVMGSDVPPCPPVVPPELDEVDLRLNALAARVDEEGLAVVAEGVVLAEGSAGVAVARDLRDALRTSAISPATRTLLERLAERIARRARAMTAGAKPRQMSIPRTNLRAVR